MRYLLLLVLLGAALVFPTSASASHGTTVWRVAMLIYQRVDATCDGRRVTNSLSAAERDQAVVRAKAAKQKIRLWAAGNGKVQLTMFYPGTVTTVSAYVSGSCWVSAPDVDAMGDWPAGFDSVYVQHPEGLHGYGGLSMDNGYTYRGSTYGTSQAWDDSTWFARTGYATRVVIHEWLHGAGGWYRARGFDVPDLHASTVHGYGDDEKGWLKAYLSGRIWSEGDGYVGLTHRAWAYGTPTLR